MQKKIIKTITVYNDNQPVNAYAKIVTFDASGIAKADEYATADITKEAIKIIDEAMNATPCKENPKILQNIYEILPSNSKYYCAKCGRKLTGPEIGYCYKHKIKPLKCRSCQHINS